MQSYFKRTLVLLLVIPLFFFMPALAKSTEINPTKIKNLVVFGDSLSDRGYSQYGGFNRYSNGKVWPEYLAQALCKHCLQDYAWGGAKTDVSNYNGFQWSGLQWQLGKYKLNTQPQETLFIIWAGLNDLIDGNEKGAEAANNIVVAIDKLVAAGAKNIIVFNLPNWTIAPAYNNPDLENAAKFSAVKEKVKQQISVYNDTLNELVANKKNSFLKQKMTIHLYVLDMANLFTQVVQLNRYKNSNDPWRGTYSYPATDGYVWWDAWHPMTSVHQQIANYVASKLHQMGFMLVDECTEKDAIE